MKTDFLQPDKMGPYASFEVPKKTEKQEKKQKNVLYVEVSGMNECTPVSGTGTRYKFRNEKSGGGYEPNMYYMYSQPISPFLFLCDEAHDLLSLLLCVSSALVCFSLICSRGGEARQQQQ